MLAQKFNELVILNWISYGMIVCGILTCILLLVGFTAYYGRYSSSSWGPLIDPKVAWFIQELPALIIPVLLWYFDSSVQREPKIVNKLLFSAYVFHYFHRSLIYPLLMKGGKGTPLLIMLMAFSFCTLNGYLQARYLLKFSQYTTSWLWSVNFIIGMLMFAVGLFINIQSDHILRTLRLPGETGYKIPRGGMFDYVSGANFFGEIVEWTGFAVACWSLPSFAFALFTACNIGPRAISHHKWYKAKFEDYPTDRKALIPFVY